MSRNGSGVYTKAVSSFSPGGTVTASDHNSLWDDAVSEITNSVAADGQTTMTGPLKASNGTAAAPALTFGSDTDTGFYRAGADSVAIALGGVAALTLTTATGTWAGASFNFGGAIYTSATATFDGGVVSIGPATFNSTISVSALATFTGGFIASATCVFTQPVLCSGTATFTNGFLASNTCSFSHPILCSGTATFTKGFIASATSSFIVTPTGPGMPKAYGCVTYSGGTPTLASGSFNIASITDVAQGNLRFTYTNAMSNATYVAIATTEGSTMKVAQTGNKSTTICEVYCFDEAGNLQDPTSVSLLVL